MITNSIVSTVFLRGTCYRFSPVWEAAHSSGRGFQKLGPCGPWEASTGRGRFLDALPRLDFSAVASLPPRRQWIPWGPGTFFQPRNILTLQMAMESGCLWQSVVARGAARAVLLRVPQAPIFASSPPCSPAAGLWGRPGEHCQLTRKTARLGAQVFPVKWCCFFQDSLKRGCYQREPFRWSN